MIAGTESDAASDAELAASALAAPHADAAADDVPGACPNCGTPRAGKFCATCGQKALPLRPTLRYFLHESTHELLHVDGKIFRSLRLLLTRPGFLTREILAGRRASYVSPLRLYLIASILAFAIGAFGSLDQGEIEYTPDPGETEASIERERQRAAAVETTVNTAFNVWLPRAMFVLVPLFAALVMLFRRGSGFTYPEHLYFSLHVHAAGFFASALDALFEAAPPLAFAAPVVDTVTELYIVGYFLVAFRRVYETTIWGTLWRGLTIGGIYIVVLMVAFFAIAAPVVWPLFAGPSS